MKRISSHTIGVDSGDVVLFSDFEDGGDMWTGNGPRERIRQVAFETPFVDAPVVHVSLALWDIGASANVRGDISTRNVTAAGFDLIFNTWGDTRVARIRASWMAIGTLVDNQDWDVNS